MKNSSADFAHAVIEEDLSISPIDPSKLIKCKEIFTADSSSQGKITKIVSLDCEMVTTENSEAIARYTLVNEFGEIIVDTFVKPIKKVKYYKEWITGINEEMLEDAPKLSKLKDLLSEILMKDTIFVGHSLNSDLNIMFLEEIPETRDISHFCKFTNKGERISLVNLAKNFLNVNIDKMPHSSVIDARVSLALYKMFQKEIDQHELTNYAVFGKKYDSKHFKFIYGKLRKEKLIENLFKVCDICNK